MICSFLVPLIFGVSANAEVKLYNLEFDYCPTSPPKICLYAGKLRGGVYDEQAFTVRCVGMKDEIVYHGRVQRVIEA